MARPRTHDETLRRKLIRHAAATVSEHGAGALSLRRLAADVGTSTTAVYSLFGSKAGLFDALYREAASLFAARLASVAATEDPAADMVRLGLAYREYALAHRHLYAVLFADRPTGLAPSTEVREEVTATLQPLLDAVTRGQRAGQLRGESAERIAMSCWGIAHGLVSLEMSGAVPDGLDVGEYYDTAMCAVVDGWRRG